MGAIINKQSKWAKVLPSCLLPVFLFAVLPQVGEGIAFMPAACFPFCRFTA